MATPTDTPQRAPWFRTENVLIPWGCDYMYQNADLMFRSTDMLIDAINANPEWGVHAQARPNAQSLGARRRRTPTGLGRSEGTEKKMRLVEAFPMLPSAFAVGHAPEKKALRC